MGESLTMIKNNQAEQWSPLEMFSSDSSANVSDVVDVNSGTEKHPKGGKDNTKKKEMKKEMAKEERKKVRQEARKEAKNGEKYKREAGQNDVYHNCVSVFSMPSNCCGVACGIFDGDQK